MMTIMKTKQVNRTWENLRTKVINRSNLLMRDQNSLNRIHKADKSHPISPGLSLIMTWRHL